MKDESPAQLTPEILLQAYAAGVFPMSESSDDPEIFWVDPRLRGIMPLDGFHISKSLAKRIRSAGFDVRFDTDFECVVRGCANRDETWINTEIFNLYNALFKRGEAHCVEVWHGPNLVGGAYGVAIGAAFFGESMFSTKVDASKIALAYLVDRLRRTGFQLLDTQFLTPHLASLGGLEVSRDVYHVMLENALDQRANFTQFPFIPTPYELLQRSAQTS